MLDFTSVQLLRDLENYVRDCQIQETPIVSRGMFTFTQDDSYLQVEDPEFSTSLYAQGRIDGIFPFLETLVTTRPASKNPVKSPVVPATAAPAKSEGRMKKRVSVDHVELLPTQPRRRSSGWFPQEEIAE